MLTNKTGISFPSAAMLCLDDYDYNPDPWTISATSLIKSTKSIVLGKQYPNDKSSIDISSLIPSVMGSAMHAWLEKSMKSEEVRERLYSMFSIKDAPDITTEHRASRKIGRWTVSGKFDMIIDRQLIDLKTCSVWSDIFDSNREQYILQGSIYRWLNPNIIINDTIQIDKWFTDWQKKEAKKKPEYPQLRIKTQHYPLMTNAETEEWLKDKLYGIQSNLKNEQDEMPPCTKDELWQNDAKYKVFKTDQSNRAMNGGVKSSMNEALAFQEDKGGVIKIFKSEVKACNWCNAMAVCDQAAEYIKSGLLVVE